MMIEACHAALAGAAMVGALWAPDAAACAVRLAIEASNVGAVFSFAAAQQNHCSGTVRNWIAGRFTSANLSCIAEHDGHERENRCEGSDPHNWKHYHVQERAVIVLARHGGKPHRLKDEGKDHY